MIITALGLPIVGTLVVILDMTEKIVTVSLFYICALIRGQSL